MNGYAPTTTCVGMCQRCRSPLLASLEVWNGFLVCSECKFQMRLVYAHPEVPETRPVQSVEWIRR